jgi:hypothetical protein
MITRSIQLSDEEAAGLKALLEATGESEEDLLRRAAARGIRDLRLEQAIKAFKGGTGSGEAALIAGLPRAIFLQKLIDRRIVILDGPSTLGEELAELGCSLGDERLVKAARLLSSK